MRKFARFLFETDFGPFIAWWAVAGTFFGLLIVLEVLGLTAVANGAGQLEFKVQYRPAHPFLAEYDKCIIFPSGKRIGLWPDTGGAGAFAVYRLPTGEYYLVDGLEHDFIRNDYRVNVTNETVEMMCGEKWFAIPDETEETK